MKGLPQKRILRQPGFIYLIILRCSLRLDHQFDAEPKAARERFYLRCGVYFLYRRLVFLKQFDLLGG